MSPPLVTGRRRVQQQLGGLLFLAVLAGLVGLTVALYQKAFTPVVNVVLETDRIGNQLSKGGDVKARGLVVGEVRKVSSDGEKARIELALQSEAAQRLPADVRAQMLPKTLFGEKFVSLVFDDDSTAERLREGAVIPQDRSETARETSQALDDLLPLLQTLRPAQLSATLNGVSTALRGRGDQLGENLELVDSYLRELNPELAGLGESFRGIADLADNLEAARPDLLAVLDNLSAVNRNLVDTEPELRTFLTTSTTFAEELAGFLGENDERLIRLAADSLPSLRLYERYSPGFPCLLKGLDKQQEFAEATFGGLQPGLHITLELTEDQNGYQPGDEPVYGESSGPTCRGLPPNPPEVPFPVDREVEDGYCDEEEQAPGVQNGCPRDGGSGTMPAAEPARALAQPQSPRERDRAAVGAAVGPVMGLASSDVPDLAVLLFGPVARGTEVGLPSRR
jgi:phospholipid/cholesterol/gamma-HCH transport system substrate-binding protein